MKWQGRRQSTNIEDRRGMSRGGLLAGGGIAGVIIIVAALLLGVDPTQLLQQVDSGGEVASAPDDAVPERQFSPEEEARKEFTAVVLGDTEDIWNQQLPAQLGENYHEPKLVLFSGYQSSACGRASTATGPFYCTGDAKIYLDLDFFVDLEQRYGAGGDFAQAYVVAHEVGHHIQFLLGILEEVRLQAGNKTRAEVNQLQVRTELQADFLAGVWAHYAHRMKNTLEPGDIEEALNAATAIGDDRLQKMQQGYVIPDSFTHGTSEQRMRWFKRGFETGDLSKLMDPFKLHGDQL